MPSAPPRPDFNALLFAHVTSHCPEHITTRDGQRAVTTEGVISYLEVVAKGESPGDPAFARETINLLKNTKP